MNARLWAPWRIGYIKNKKTRGCIFCAAKKYPSKNHIIFKTRYSIVMLNIFPYNNGHLMVSPLRHVKDFSLLRQEEALDLLRAINKAKALLDRVLKPDGYNIGMNISRSAGAGIAGHIHMHVVPRWKADVNFMTSVYGERVISQSLDELQKLLKNAYSKTD